MNKIRIINNNILGLFTLSLNYLRPTPVIDVNLQLLVRGCPPDNIRPVVPTK
jgi:hypothetical protein